jgi:ATP-dependent helicase/nuclease subunit A
MISASPFSLTSGHGRIVGTVVHEWLQTIADDGLEDWPVSRLDTVGARIRRQLNASGVADVSVEELSSKVLKCLANTLVSDRGRWLLSSYPEQANELALNGLIDGQIVHAVVDRTFVDQSGVRWVVDYKTSSCPDNTPLDRFLDQEADRYRSQLKLYATLLLSLDTVTKLSCGLFFPMHDSWIEVKV